MRFVISRSVLPCDQEPHETVSTFHFLAGLSKQWLGQRVQLPDGLQRAARVIEKSSRLTDVDSHYGKALNLLLSARVREAFDLSGESVC